METISQSISSTELLREHILRSYEIVANRIADSEEYNVGIVLKQWPHTPEGVPLNELMEFTEIIDAIPRDLFHAAILIIEDLVDDVPPMTQVRIVPRTTSGSV